MRRIIDWVCKMQDRSGTLAVLQKAREDIQRNRVEFLQGVFDGTHNPSTRRDNFDLSDDCDHGRSVGDLS